MVPKYENVSQELYESNKKMLEELKLNEIKKLLIYSLGNSISTGYSMLNSNAPLIKRNESLPLLCALLGIELETHQFSRLCNNDDEYIFNLVLKNTLESDFNQVTIRDYKEKQTSKEVTNLDLDLISTYYPSTLDIDKGVLDVLKEYTLGTANIVIANMGTGSLIANWGYQGNHLLTGGIKKDCTYIEALLGLIQKLNREGANTQVYLCGAPRVLNLPAADMFLNPKLKDIASRYANVTYVPNFPKQAFYPNDRNPFFVDPHYNESEYLKLLSVINQRITDNYQMRKYMIEIDRILSIKSKEVEMTLIKLNTYDEVMNIIETYAKKILESGKDMNLFLQMLQTYLLERYPYDYAFLSKQAIKDSTRVLKRK